jgi:sialate O-acetylesterase
MNRLVIEPSYQKNAEKYRPNKDTTVKKIATALCLACLALCASTARADVKLPPVISDHMVLQRDAAAPIWGSASPGEQVSVSIAGQAKTTTADAQGHWQVKLDPLKVAEGLTLTVTGKNTITIQDVLVGEVWLGSGQSNMDMHVPSYTNNDSVLAQAAAATYPKLRLLHKGRAGWETAVPTNNFQFSALLFAFGFRLQQELDVPVGIMVGAVGGTPSGYWLTEDMLHRDAACQAQAQEFAKTYDFEAAMKKYDQELAVWKVAAEKAKLEKGKAPRTPTLPAKAGESAGRIGGLYIANVQPYAPYAIRGVLWDQGESGTAITGVDQFNLMGALIHGWRKDWDQDFAFLYVQKGSGGGTAWDLDNPVTKNASKFSPLPAREPGNGDGLYRELHIKIQQHPKTAMVTSTDLGSGTHPTNKAGYGERAVRVALGFVYGQNVEISGPLYASHKIEGNRVTIKFTHVGQGLAARHSDKLQGFMLAGADQKFHWADAVIDGDSVVVSCAAVPQPVAVRYAWSSNAPWANLFNKDGLPAQTFRTDDWK